MFTTRAAHQADYADTFFISLTASTIVLFSPLARYGPVGTRLFTATLKHLHFLSE
jgi:hypothetical protein